MSIHQSNTTVPDWDQFSPLDASVLASLVTTTPLATLLGLQNNGCHGVGPGRNRRPGVDDTEFSPEVDVFDTPTSYVIHVSLPGARKEDIGINYDEDKSEIQISGVVLRKGDEEFLRSLKISERNAGLFEKKVRLGDLRHPAAVDADKITAKLENGVLEVIIPKSEKKVTDKMKVQIN